MMDSAVLLDARGISKHFLGVSALTDVDLTINTSELVGLIGPNGSGKTTFFNCISGLLKQDKGSVEFRGADITNMRPDLIARKGIRRTFQDIHNFANMTVLDNLLIAIQQQQEDSIWQRAIRSQRVRHFEQVAHERAKEVLEMVGLAHKARQFANELSYGQRKLLEFGAALMPDPALILLDEPTAAVSAQMIKQMKELILNLHQHGKSFLIVEHNMKFIMDISERIVVLDYGQKIAEGTPKEVQTDARVLEAYFGR